jgi:type II secretory pathway component PulJ
LGIFTNSLDSSQRILETGKLQRDLNAIMDGIVADVQRAGYWANATSSNTNPFFASGTDIATNAAGNCATFAYDRDQDGTVADSERFGYRLGTNAIQFRPAGSTADCSAASNNWVDLTDPNVIIITGFTTTLTTVPVNPSSGTDTTNYRTLTITISGYLKTNSATTKTITRTIKLYNNKYVP